MAVADVEDDVVAEHPLVIGAVDPHVIIIYGLTGFNGVLIAGALYGVGVQKVEQGEGVIGRELERGFAEKACSFVQVIDFFLGGRGGRGKVELVGIVPVLAGDEEPELIFPERAAESRGWGGLGVFF